MTGGAVKFALNGDAVTAYRPGCECEPVDADGHAFELLFWLDIRKFPCTQFPSPLWVSAGDLEELLYPEFLAHVGWQAHPWQTVARELRKHTQWRRRDCRQGAHRRGSSLTQYRIRDKLKPLRCVPDPAAMPAYNGAEVVPLAVA